MRKNQEIDRFGSAVRAILKDFHIYARKLLMQKGLTRSQFNILELLADGKELNMYCLKEHLAVTSPVATKIVDNLVKKDFVKRGRWGADRREVRVVITRKGRDLIKILDISRKKFFRSLLNSISQEEKEKFLGIVKKISLLIAKQ